MKKTLRSRLSIILKTGIFIIAAAYIFFMLRKKEDFTDSLYNALFLNHNYLNGLFISAFLLFPVNWAFETLKWKYLVRKAEHINFFKAYRGILTGVTFGLITPFSIGDYFGRILQLSDPERVKVIGAVFLSRISQFFITLVFGGLAMSYFIAKTDYASPLIWGLAIFSMASIMLLLLLFVYHHQVMLFVGRVSFFSPVYRYFEILDTYDNEDILKVVFYSFLRYLVFSLQFVVLFTFFSVSTDFVLLTIGVMFIFLVKSIVPTILDLGVREASAIYFFAAFGLTSENNIIYASLSLWSINILLPALIGMFLISKIKLFIR